VLVSTDRDPATDGGAGTYMKMVSAKLEKPAVAANDPLALAAATRLGSRCSV
jgi:hypothetical protein